MSDKEKVNLYRTMFLMAHNRLHDVISGTPELESYLSELQSAEVIAKQPA